MAQELLDYFEYRQGRMINTWCRSKGIQADDLIKHPRIDDISILLLIKDSYGRMMNTSETAAWGGYWSSIYHKKNKLTDKKLRRIEGMVKALQQREQEEANKLLKIKELRLS
jgi:hypothetical protein